MDNLDKLTNYDIIEILKKNIVHEKTRHLFEGSTVLAIPLIISIDSLIQGDRDYTSPQYKLKISKFIRNYFAENSDKNFDEINKIIFDNTKILEITSTFDSKIKNAHESLYFMSLKISSNISSKDKKIFYEIFGKQIEKKFKKFYTNKGYSTKIDDNRNMNKYLRSEFEFFTRVANNIYQKFH